MTSAVLFRLKMEVVIQNTVPARSSSHLQAVEGSFGPSHTGEIYPPLTTLLFLYDAAHAWQGLLRYNSY
jgi:hypothetical protein